MFFTLKVLCLFKIILHNVLIAGSWLVQKLCLRWWRQRTGIAL